MGTSSVATILSKKNKASWSLEDLFKQAEAVKSADTIREYPEDILTLSCCLQRLVHDRTNKFSRSLTDPELPTQVTDLDRKKAENIRKYYKDKLMVLTLRGQKLTKYREDLHNFLYSQPTKVLDSHMGMVYKLPYFYDYDKQIDDIFKSIYAVNKKDKSMAEESVRKLTFIKKVEIQRRHINNVEYWFEDDQLNKVMIDFPITNTLLPLFDNLVNQGPVAINTRYYTKRKDMNDYFVTNKWSFA